MAIKKLYSSDSRRRTISKLNSNFVAITPDVILEISDKSPTENMDSIIWIDTSMDTITKEINTKTYADEYFASHLTIDKNTFKYIGTDGEPTLEFKKMLYGDDYDPSFKYILKPKNGVFTKFCIPIKAQNGITGYNLNSIVFDIKDTTDLYEAFNSANYLKSIDISSWNTSNVTDMGYMLNGCRSLTSIDLSKWNTSKVTDMRYMLNGCRSLTSIDLSKWNTSKVTDMRYVFNFCSSLTSLDVSKWDISKVTNMQYIFAYCGSLASIDISNWNISSVTNMEGIFYNCSSLTSIDLSKWNTSKVTFMSYMFADCGSLTTITGILDLKKCTSYSSMFANCTKLTSVKVKNLPTDIDTFCTRAKIDKSKVIVVQ